GTRPEIVHGRAHAGRDRRVGNRAGAFEFAVSCRPNGPTRPGRRNRIADAYRDVCELHPRAKSCRLRSDAGVATRMIVKRISCYQALLKISATVGACWPKARGSR